MNLEYFQLIDRIVAISLDDRTIRTEATVPLASTVFEGHFPGYPVLPGVLLIEAMAQTAGWLVIATTSFERMPFLMAVNDVKFRRFANPGERLALEAGLTHEGSGYAVTKARIEIDGKPVSDAEIRFRLMPFPSPEFRAHMDVMARRLELPLRALRDG